MTSGKGKVLLAMSGGVDSSVAAAMLLEDGYEVVGVFMRLGSPGEALDELLPGHEEQCDASRIRIGKQGCCSINDAADARLVAAQLGIPFYVCNFKKDFGRIIDYFVEDYAQGRTPNPCVRCNDWLKFGKLHDYARQIDAQYVASGHYARVVRNPQGGLTLGRGVDSDKDQSYVLFGVPRQQLSHMLLPIGEFTKPEIRERAEALGLPVFDKPDSQEICFVPDNDYAGLIERRRPELSVEGRILDQQGNTIGQHAGQHHFTIGQRRGIGVAVGEPIYVVDKDPESNTITVGSAEDLQIESCESGEANWLCDIDADRWHPCWAKYRYNTPAAKAQFRLMEDGVEQTTSGRMGRFEVRFDTPQRAVAPGQAIVLYDASSGQQVLGGGWIQTATHPRQGRA